ncbi:ABC transporter ATP-binding protein [Streptomyces sp. NPDC004031]
MSVYAVEAEGLGKRFRRVEALRDCSFRLPAGGVVALVGANGAGKSTLMGIVAGLLPATAGAVRVHGRPVGERAARVAILAQDKPLYRDFSPADMLRFGRATNRVWDQRRAVAWLERFAVPVDRPCGRLSGGQRAQVSLAVALGSRPALLLLDEPLSNLDPVARTEVTGELMGEAADTGMTVMLSTHIVAELSGVGDHLLLLVAGRPVLTGDVEDLLARHVRLSGPRAERPPGPGEVVAVRHTARQSVFTVREEGVRPPVVAPGWTSRPLTLEDLVLTYLRDPRTAEAAA